MSTLVTVIACFLNLPTDIMKLKTLKGLALQDILTEVHLYVHRGQFILACTAATRGRGTGFFHPRFYYMTNLACCLHLDSEKWYKEKASRREVEGVLSPQSPCIFFVLLSIRLEQASRPENRFYLQQET